LLLNLEYLLTYACVLGRYCALTIASCSNATAVNGWSRPGSSYAFSVQRPTGWSGINKSEERRSD